MNFKEESRTLSAARNFIWGLFFIFVTSVSPFIVRTLIIRIWNIEYAGLSGLFTSILNIMNLTELGLGEAMVYSMYKPMAEKDTDKVNALLNLYKKIYITIGMVLMVVGIMVIPIIPRLVNGAYPKGINIYVVYLFQLITLVEGYLIFPYSQAIFQSNQSTYLTDRFAAIIFLCMYILQSLVIVVVKNYYCYSVMLPLCTLIICIGKVCIVRKKFPKYKPTGKLDRDFYSPFYKRVGGMVIRKIRNQILGSIDSVVISSMLGLAVLGKYQNYMLLLAVPNVIMNAFTHSILQVFGNSVAVESREKNYNIIKLYSFCVQWIGICFAAVLLCTFSPFINIWLHNSNLLFLDRTAVLFSVLFYVTCITKITDLIRNGTGIWWKGKWIPIVEIVTNIILDIVLGYYWGVDGIILATIISIVIIHIPFETINLYKNYFSFSSRIDLLELGVSCMKLGVVLLVSFSICRLFNGSALYSLVMSVLCSFLISNLLLLVMNYKDDRFHNMLRLIKKQGK